LTREGYAWAVSSYRRNSYDPGFRVIDSKNLTNHIQTDRVKAASLTQAPQHDPRSTVTANRSPSGRSAA